MVVDDPGDVVLTDVLVGGVGADPAYLAAGAGPPIPALPAVGRAIPADPVCGARVAAIAEHDLEAVADDEVVAPAGDGAADVALEPGYG